MKPSIREARIAQCGVYKLQLCSMENVMLSVYSSTGGDAAKAYFFSGLMHGDYYAEGQERVGQWWGKGADILGLSGSVKTRDFCRLVDNEHPATRDRLTLRNDADRRAGYDLTFCPCKSLSLVALLNGDERLIDAARASVQVMLEEAERLVQTRVRKDGAVDSRFTNNLTVAMFPHLTARPERGQLPDPLVHLHAYAINATFDVEEHCWKALEAVLVKSNAQYLDAVCMSDLARRVMDIGYEVERKGQYWEIKRVPAEAIEVLSKRSARVNAEAAARNIDDPKEKAGLAAKTRGGKAPEHTLSELQSGWWSQLPKDVAKRLRAVRPKAHGPRPLSPEVTHANAVRLVRSVSAGLFERSSTVVERSLVEKCLRAAPGQFDPVELRAAIADSGLQVRDHNGTRRVTDPAIYREEREIVKTVKDGKGRCKPLDPTATPPTGLTRGQAKAYKHLMASRDRFSVVQGRPGTGKTSLARSARQSINGGLREIFSPLLGDKVVFIAPTTVASRVVLREEGFKDADTVARFLTDQKLQSKARGGWLWVDEAGQLGTKDSLALVKLATDLDARVVFSGDRQQNRSVARGSILDVLVEHAGVQSPHMEEVVRQKGRMKEIVNTFIQGNVAQGLAALKNDGNLTELPSGQCQRAAAEEYVKRVKSKEKVAIIAPTHREAEHVTHCVRDELKAAKELGPDHSKRRWKDTKLSEAEREDPRNYKKGQMVQLNRPLSGFDFGKQYEVVSVSPIPIIGVNDRVLVRAKGEMSEALPLKHAGRWSLYDAEDISVAEGDSIMITRTTKVHTRFSKFRSQVIEQFDLPEQQAKYPKVELANGTVHKVKGFHLNGDINLEGNRVLPKDFGHFTHGYCRTSHSAQAMTTDSAIVVATKGELAPVDQRSFLVAVTRAKTTLKVFTDDVTELQKAASTLRPEVSAIDLLDEGQSVSHLNRRAAADRVRTDEYVHRKQQAEKEKGHERGK